MSEMDDRGEVTEVAPDGGAFVVEYQDGSAIIVVDPLVRKRKPAPEISPQEWMLLMWGTDEGFLLGQVSEAADVLQAAEDRLRDAVTRARSAGVTWEDLAATLGVSRQAVAKRFGR